MFQVHRVLPGAMMIALVALLVGPSALRAGASDWYLQGKLGNVDLDAQFGSSDPKSLAGEEDVASFEVGYSVGRYLALQAGYHDFGEYTGGGSPCPQHAEVCAAVVVPLRAELTGLSFSAMPQWPFNDRWSAFGRLGILAWESDVALAGGSFGHRRIESFEDRDLLAGVGMRYELPSGFGLLVERQRFDLTGGWINLGASLRF